MPLMPAPKRDDRMSGGAAKRDQRTPAQLDRDRILYSTEFRRLAGVTQVVSPGEGEIFHSRLTHTLKVAQVARRLAEMFLAKDKENNPKLARRWRGIDPDVVESAALAHDLGHPPFGHLAEHELSRLVAEEVVREKYNLTSSAQLSDAAKADLPKTEGYEGNAQSFRIITTLAVRRPDSPSGLDLTRATLNATLKYPRLFSEDNPKYGVYSSAEDVAAFQFAREIKTPTGDLPCIEAQIMDWADDIAYSVHDVEDFYRAGRIPLDRLRSNPRERTYFREKAIKRRKDANRPFPIPYEEIAKTLDNFLDFYIDIEGPYDGSRSRRQRLYNCTSNLIHTFLSGTSLRDPENAGGKALERSEIILTLVDLLKELIWCYVIYNPSLAGHQHGQRQVVRTLFQVLNEACMDGRFFLFPAAFKDWGEELRDKHNGNIPAAPRARLVADAISSMTDQQALRLYQRLTASSQGSVLDPIVI
jgi:dGTPase